MHNLNALRTAIDEVIKTASDDAALSTIAIIAKVRSDHANILATAQKELETVALTKIVNEVATRKKGRYATGQMELFGGYAGVPQTITVKLDGEGFNSRPQRRGIGLVPVKVLQAWYEKNTQSRPTNLSKHAGVKKLLDDAVKYVRSTDDTVEQALAEKARQEASDQTY